MVTGGLDVSTRVPCETYEQANSPLIKEPINSIMGCSLSRSPSSVCKELPSCIGLWWYAWAHYLQWSTKGLPLSSPFFTSLDPCSTILTLLFLPCFARLEYSVENLPLKVKLSHPHLTCSKNLVPLKCTAKKDEDYLNYEVENKFQVLADSDIVESRLYGDGDKN
ncbi:hypothetical protein PanWU01x14_090090 [Parasponia andersonii]|uniref:Uncharacterized protein n=1 Tax=Parasponia andersonii TaxID=3476 RepID=A0A2P5D7R3_PARAD|nr:hypothetical protein PanWU01x14_090090 [Parasponia andersonii]